MDFETELQKRVNLVVNEMTDYLIDGIGATDEQELIERWQRILLQIDDWNDGDHREDYEREYDE